MNIIFLDKENNVSSFIIIEDDNICDLNSTLHSNLFKVSPKGLSEEDVNEIAKIIKKRGHYVL